MHHKINKVEHIDGKICTKAKLVRGSYFYKFLVDNDAAGYTYQIGDKMHEDIASGKLITDEFYYLLCEEHYGSDCSKGSNCSCDASESSWCQNRIDPPPYYLLKPDKDNCIIIYKPKIKMRTLTKQNVLDAVENLFSKQNAATTLEVKNNLRNLGFSAAQREVSDLMMELHDENHWDFTSRTNRSGNEHRIYTPPLAKAKAKISQQSKTLPSNKQSKRTVVKLDPIEIYCGSSATALMDGDYSFLGKFDKSSWLVKLTDSKCTSSSQEYHVYDAKESRDHVRCNYAKTNQVKIQDVRACRIKSL